MIYGILYIIVLVLIVAFFKGADMNNNEYNETQLQETK